MTEEVLQEEANPYNAKKEWHTDPQTSKISSDKNIQKMSDFLEKMDELGEEE